MFKTVACFSILATLCGSVPVKVDQFYEHHEAPSQYSSWVKGARLDSNAIVPLRVRLRQQNTEFAMQHLLDVSDPDSEAYGKHWSREKVKDYFVPSAETIATALEWLGTAGISRSRVNQTEDREWLVVDVTVKQLETLVDARYHEYQHVRTKRKGIATGTYRLPEDLRNHVDYILPGVKPSPLRKLYPSNSRSLSRRSHSSLPALPELKSHKHHKLSNSTRHCATGVTPACIRALYDIPLPNLHCQPNPNNSLGVYEAADVYIQKDLDLFFKTFESSIGFQIPKGTHPILRGIDGGNIGVPWNSSYNTTFFDIIDSLPSNQSLFYSEVFAHQESELDFSVAYPIIYPQTITLYQVLDPIESVQYQGGGYEDFLDAIDGTFCSYGYKNQSGNDPFYDGEFPDTLISNNSLSYKGKLQCGVYRPTKVISISYVGYEYSHPASYNERICNELTKLALQGHTFVFPAGDRGQATNAGTCIGANAQAFVPRFPATCPAVLSVGATMIKSNGTISEPEVVASVADAFEGRGFYSGGGFSNVFNAPSYQRQAIHAYFASYDPGFPSFNATKGWNPNTSHGRYNKHGRGYPDVSANGGPIPIFSNGKTTTAYGTSAAVPIWASILNRINEVRLASNKSVVGFVNPILYKNPHVLNDVVQGHGLGCNTTGFSAVKGWDPISGLGTPNYLELEALFLSLS